MLPRLYPHRSVVFLIFHLVLQAGLELSIDIQQRQPSMPDFDATKSYRQMARSQSRVGRLSYALNC